MSNKSEELQKLISKVEALKTFLSAETLFDSSIVRFIFQLFETETFTKQQIEQTIVSFAGSLHSIIEELLKDEKIVNQTRKEINTQLKSVFQP